MLNDQNNANQPNREPSKEYADLYAQYRDGIREVSVTVNAKSDFRLLLTLVNITLGGVAFALIAAEQYALSFATTILVLLGAIGAVMALRRTDAKTSKESTHESNDFRT